VTCILSLQSDRIIKRKIAEAKQNENCDAVAHVPATNGGNY